MHKDDTPSPDMSSEFEGAGGEVPQEPSPPFVMGPLDNEVSDSSAVSGIEAVTELSSPLRRQSLMADDPIVLSAFAKKKRGTRTKRQIQEDRNVRRRYLANVARSATAEPESSESSSQELESLKEMNKCIAQLRETVMTYEPSMDLNMTRSALDSINVIEQFLVHARFYIRNSASSLPQLNENSTHSLPAVIQESNPSLPAPAENNGLGSVFIAEDQQLVESMTTLPLPNTTADEDAVIAVASSTLVNLGTTGNSEISNENQNDTACPVTERKPVRCSPHMYLDTGSSAHLFNSCMLLNFQNPRELCPPRRFFGIVNSILAETVADSPYFKGICFSDDASKNLISQSMLEEDDYVTVIKA